MSDTIASGAATSSTRSFCGCGTYTWGLSRNLVSTPADYGAAATPNLIHACSSDDVNLAQTDFDTLTTNGPIYATTTFSDSDQTSDNSSTSPAAKRRHHTDGVVRLCAFAFIDAS
jgi:hypothetical protein